MNKKIVLMFSLWLFSTTAISEMPDFCNSGAYTCYQTGPNSAVVYPVSNPDMQSKKESRRSRDTYYNIERDFSESQDVIDVDLTNLTWGVYDNAGELLRSGRVSGGKDFCSDIGRNCETVTGTFTIYRKGDENCKSTRFPVGKGGAPMPYCMFFHGGYALHGSNSVPDYNASHGCVRMSPEDAQWLNEEFVQEGLTRVHVHY